VAGDFVKGHDMKKTIRDPERTREKLLTHATAEFSAKGYDGARVDSIAARCRLSKNMLYYYFGNKESLFVAVLERIYEKLRARQADLEILDDDPEEAMRKLVKHTFYAFLDQPEAIRLLNDENMHKGRHIRRSKRIRELYDPLVVKLGEVLRRGNAEGIFRSGLDPVFLYLSLSSLAYHYISNQYTLELALGIALTSEESRESWLTHITDMVVLYCRKEAAGPTASSPRARAEAAF
jgi:TetR/AcrR family transcriptional regulator